MRPNGVVVAFQKGKIRVLSDNQEFIDKAMKDMPKSTHRASHIYPINPIKKWGFIFLRKIFGDKGRIAGWTRNWTCPWYVTLAPMNGPNLGPFSCRKDAIKAEKEWLWKNKKL